jgi:hypothetical protein
VELKQVAKVLREDNLIATFVPKEVSDDEENPVDQVTVLLSTDRFEDDLRMQIIRINPTDDENFVGLMHLQFFVGLPIEVEATRMDTIIRALPIFNTILPLVGFNVHVGEGIVYWRHVALIPETGDDVSAVLRHTIWLAYYLLEKWGPALTALADGDVELDDLV